MPTVSVLKEELLAQLGMKFSDDEFDQLCFDFGVELDEITSEKLMATRERGEAAAEGLSDAVLYKIDVPANRYDILCLEGIARALRIFLGLEQAPLYHVETPPNNKIFTMTQTKETLSVRPFVVCAVLRNLKFDPVRYQSFLDLQDKLHQNIGRRRTLIAIGTHDLDTLKPPFTYEALPQKDISFIALGETQERNVEELFHYYKNVKANCHLKPYLGITENHPNHPVIFDSNRTVLSLPPIINGEHSKITLDTENVFIECTGTDYTKLNIVLNIMVSMFSQYCSKPFSVEQCAVIKPDGKRELYPQLVDTEFVADVDYINRGLGLALSPSETAEILTRMQLPTTVHASGANIVVRAPPTRPDILHACDIQEDVAIAYGYNNMKRTVPQFYSMAQPQPLNKLSDLLRGVVAEAGFLEVLTWVLINYEENFKFLNREDDGKCVLLANPKQDEFNVVRTSLLPGLLKTLLSNKGVPLPVRIFELSDVVLQDGTADVGAKNSRRLAALFNGMTSGLEDIHSLLDRVMKLNDIAFEHADNTKDTGRKRRSTSTYALRPSANPTFFSGRCADVLIDGKLVGVFGILHPTVLANFHITTPCSALEMDVECFL